MGLEVAVGFLIAWFAGKARRFGKQLDGVADQAVDAAGARVKDLVLAKIGGDTAVARLEEEAAAGTVSDRTRRRVEMALEEAVESDPSFGASLREALGGAVATDGGIAISGGVHGYGSGTTIGAVGGDVVQGDPRRPDRR